MSVSNGAQVPRSTSSEAYTLEYFTKCQGYEEFASSHGRVLPLRLSIPLDLGAITPDARVLDVGCGRGELLLHAAQRGATVYGVDYADDAVRIARDVLRSNRDIVGGDRMALQRANARLLPFASGVFDRVFMLDIVEHLYPEELSETLAEVRRVLKPGGYAVIHTMPNTWYYRFGYPLYRLAQRLRGKRLPSNPRERWAYYHVHVNEQNPVSLSRYLRKAGFSARVWLAPAQTYEYEHNWLYGKAMDLLTRLYPFRWIFCNDLFAIATRP